MAEKRVEWDLGFSREEVLAGLERLLSREGYKFQRERVGEEERFFLPFAPNGPFLELCLRSLPPRRLGPVASMPHTLLAMRFVGMPSGVEERFLYQLTLAFLRTGG